MAVGPVTDRTIGSAGGTPPASAPSGGATRAGAGLFGSTGYLVGSTTGRGEADTGSAAAAFAGKPTAPSGSQVTTDRSELGPVPGPLAESWLPRLDGYASSAEPGGPAVQEGEQLRVSCTVNATIGIHFVQYRSAGDLNDVRVTRQQQNPNATRIAPGAAPFSARRSSASGRTTGSYIEFGLKANGRTLIGIWWDDAASVTAAYVETQRTDDADGGWQPLRDIWQLHS